MFPHKGKIHRRQSFRFILHSAQHDPQNWTFDTNFSMSSAILISTCPIPLSPSLPSSLIDSQNHVQPNVSMVTCNYPKHQRFSLNNPIRNLKGVSNHPPPPPRLVAFIKSMFLVKYILKMN